jgi:hypothetical protein
MIYWLLLIKKTNVGENRKGKKTLNGYHSAEKPHHIQQHLKHAWMINWWMDIVLST